MLHKNQDLTFANAPYPSSKAANNLWGVTLDWNIIHPLNPSIVLSFNLYMLLTKNWENSNFINNDYQHYHFLLFPLLWSWYLASFSKGGPVLGRDPNLTYYIFQGQVFIVLGNIIGEEGSLFSLLPLNPGDILVLPLLYIKSYTYFSITQIKSMMGRKWTTIR